MKRVGFIGVGIMGSSMVRNLMKDGHEVHIYARNKEKVEQVIADGAVFHDTIAECVKGRDAVITIVGYPQDVEDVYLGEDKILESADPGTYLIDMTTTSPSLDAQLAKEAAEKGLKMLDAPVTGSGLVLDSLANTVSHYEKLSEEGLGRLGMQALMKYYEK